MPTKIFCNSIATASIMALSAHAFASSSESKTPVHAEQQVTFQQIRNATIKLEYAGTTFLIDPMLAEKGAYPGFAGSYRSELRNPLVDLPLPIEDVVKSDVVVVTHTHLDHWDDAAKKALPKTMPLIVQNQTDAQNIRKDEFTNIQVLSGSTVINGTSLTRTEGQHGSDEAVTAMPTLSPVMGVVFQRPGYKTVYIAGDTIWNADVDEAIKKFQPDVIILNTGYARMQGFEGSIIMGKEDLKRAYQAAPRATVIASHMDAVNHGMQTRKELTEYLKTNDMDEARVLVPEDGEIYRF